MPAATDTVDPTTLLGTRLRVHVNLQNGKLALSSTGGKVLAYVDSATLIGVRFHVSESMRQRTIKMHRRKVLAWGIGMLQAVNDANGTELASIAEPITFNPFKAPTFVRAGTPVLSAVRVVFVDRVGYEVV